MGRKGILWDLVPSSYSEQTWNHSVILFSSQRTAPLPDALFTILVRAPWWLPIKHSFLPRGHCHHKYPSNLILSRLCLLCPVSSPAWVPSPLPNALLMLPLLSLPLSQSQDHHHLLDPPSFSFGPGSQSSNTSLCLLSTPLCFSLKVHLFSPLDNKLKDNRNYLCPVLNL